MPKIVQINSVVNIGSTGRIAEQIGVKVLQNGWESIIAYGRDAAESDSELIKIGDRTDVYAHYVMSRLSDCQGLKSRKPTKRLLDRLSVIKPHVVHIHNLHGHYINYPLLLTYLRDNRIPTVITLHDFWLVTGHCAYIHNSCKKWMFGCESCPRLKSYPSSLLDRSRRNWMLKRNLFRDFPNLVLVPVSEWLDSKVSKSILKDCSSKVVPNGIDTTKFYYDDTPDKRMSDDCVNILCVATRWTEANGFLKIMQLAETIGFEARIIIVGISESQQKNLPSNVIGIPRTESVAELRQLYSQADVLLNPSTEHTFGLVTAEAMACGIPAIVFRDTAGKEIVGDTGFAIDDFDEIPSLIRRIKRDKDQKPNIACIDRIKSKYDLDTTLDSYMSLYKSLMENEY